MTVGVRHGRWRDDEADRLEVEAGCAELLAVRRAADGSINLQRLLSPTAPAAPVKAQASTESTETAAPAETAAPWQVAVTQLELWTIAFIP